MNTFHARTRLVIVGLLACCAASVVRAEPPAADSIPAVLKPWIPWVLDGVGDEQCPNVNGVRTCIWPSALEFTVAERGATFTLRVTTDRKLGVALPGSIEHWPLDVRVDNQAAVVIEPDAAPVVMLSRGAHVVSGRFVWDALPDSLQIPSNIGSLVLTANGTRVPFPKREASGLLWLKQSRDSGEETEKLEVSVHRRLQDAVPLSTTTRIQIAASGKAREIVLKNVLVEGTRPIELRANLPAQLGLDGTLRVQAQAGSYRVEIVAIRETPTDALRAPSAAAPWPEHEIWVWQADDTLRHAEISGVPQIDPARTDLDADWIGLPTYVVGQGKGFAIETRRRGEPEPPPNKLNLTRTLWLDLDGDGYTVRDALTGQLTRGYRLDLLAGDLGHVAVDGIDQLVTRHAKHSGVELRKGQLAMQAEWHMPKGRGDLPAVGYSENVDSLGTELNLPPGFMLLGGHGVDRLGGSWIDDWDLFDFFFVLLVSLAVGQVAGRAFTALCLIALVLSHHQQDAPEMAWVVLLGATALSRVIESGRWAKIAKAMWLASLLGLLSVAIPFSVNQVRTALYPHLQESERWESSAQDEAGRQTPSLAMLKATTQAPSAPQAQPEPTAEAMEEESPERLSASSAGGPIKTSSGGKAGGVQSNVYGAADVDTNTVVQTGPGVPTWRFRVANLSWSGPVERSQRVSLCILPPPLTRLWSLLSVLFSGALLFALLRAAKLTNAAPTTTAAAALMLALSCAPSPLHAQAQIIPPSDVLDALRTRLLKPETCEPHCVSVPTLSLSVDEARLLLRVEVNAGARTAYQIPGPLESWAPDTLRVDGRDALAAARFDDGFLYVRLEPGLHRVELSGPVPRSQALTLALGTPPHRVEAQAKGWLIEGLSSDGRAEGSLSLRREVSLDATHENAEQTLAQWLMVRRELDLGVRFRVHTTITRLGPASESMLVRLPLLTGESVTEAGLVSEHGSVVVELRRDQAEVAFASTLVPQKRITLTAARPNDRDGGPVTHPWNETWVVRPSTLYRASFEGLAPVSQLNADGLYEPVYKPWPGESLTIVAARLEAAQGASVTIDRAAVTFTPGTRMERSELSLHVRTSRGTTERLDLPADATLTSLSVDGTPRPARIKQHALELHLDPGTHDIALEFQRPVGMAFFYAPPPLTSLRPLTNITSSVALPDDRWLLWVRGPSWGPAVLFWGHLIVVLLAAFGLSRVPLTPLKLHHWLLLGLGLTQVDVTVVLIITGWLFALALRERHVVAHRWAFNIGQIMLVGLTLVALSCLGDAVHSGLVVQPDMQVRGVNSNNQLLHWYTDRSGGMIPAVSVWSAPLWIYKGLMLCWALWLASSLLRWLRWAWSAFRSGGAWRSRVETPVRAPVAQDTSP